MLYKKLRNASSEQLRKVNITPDLSYQEGMHQKNLHLELQRQKDAGESNLVIYRGQIVIALRAAPEMDHSPSLSSSSASVSSGVGNTFSFTSVVTKPLFKSKHINHDHKLAIINCQSIVNKYIDLQALITSEEIDLILATESHLDHTIYSMKSKWWK